MPTGDRGGRGAQAPSRLFRIEPLREDHDRADFECGKETLDRFIRHQVFQWKARSLAQPYVLVSTAAPTRVLGYFTLNMTRIDASDLPSNLAKKFPRSAEIGAVLLGKLAVDHIHQRQGLGRDLLMAALDFAAAASERVAAFAVVVDAIDEDAARFYERHGFAAFPETPHRLFLPVKTHVDRVNAARIRIGNE